MQTQEKGGWFLCSRCLITFCKCTYTELWRIYSGGEWIHTLPWLQSYARHLLMAWLFLLIPPPPPQQEERDGARTKGRSLIAPVRPPLHPLLKLAHPLWDCFDLFMFTRRCSCRRRHLCEEPCRDGRRGGTGWQRLRQRGERGKGWSDRWRSVWSRFDKGTELCGLSATSLVIIYVDFFFFFFKFAVCALYEIDKKPQAPHCARLGCSS